jgi:MFS-type transporter involved in bile tolerance (Atg22 family)
LTGLGVASFYPLTLSLAIGSADGNEAQAGARASLASGVAIMFLPLLLGRFADSAGLKSAFVLVAVLFGSFFLMMLLSRHIRCGSQAFQDQVE